MKAKLKRSLGLSLLRCNEESYSILHCIVHETEVIDKVPHQNHWIVHKECVVEHLSPSFKGTVVAGIIYVVNVIGHIQENIESYHYTVESEIVCNLINCLLPTIVHIHKCILALSKISRRYYRRPISESSSKVDHTPECSKFFYSIDMMTCRVEVFVEEVEGVCEVVRIFLIVNVERGAFV